MKNPTESQSWKTDVSLLSEAYAQIQNKSIIQDIIQSVYDAPDLESAKAIFKDRVEKSRIPIPVKRKMILVDMPQINELVAFQQYVTNSMMKKLGMGV